MSGGDGGAADRGGEARWLRPFPDGEGSDPFLRTFKEAVVPGDWLRALREDVLPVLVLDTTGRDGEETSQRATRVLDGLEGTLVQSGREDGYDGQRLTPYARPAAPGKELPAGEHLVLKAGQELRANVPRKAAKLPYRHLRLMEDLTRGIRENPGSPVPGGRALRDHAYGLRAEDADSGFLHHLARLAEVSFNGPLAWLSDLLTLFGEPLFHRFPRWCWTRWWTRRLLRSKRNWYEQWRRMGKTDESVFEKVNQLLTRQSERLGRDEEAAEAARQDIEELLLRALLADLDDARPGRFGPRARRRRTRRVVLLDLPSAGAPSAAATGRFLRAYRNAAGSPGTASLLVAGAGTASPSQQREGRRCRNLRHGTELFAPVQAEAVALPLLVPMQHQGFDEEGIFVTSVGPATPRPDIRLGTEIGAEVAVCAVALAVIAALIPWGPPAAPDDACYDGSRVAGTRPPKPLPARATEKDTARKQYDGVVERIRQLNESAVESERKKDESTRSTVRKVVYLGATVPSDPEEAIDNGAVPELRGLLLAQERLNADAVDDRENRVRLYVDVRDTGNKFEDVVDHAEQVVKEAKRFKESKDHRTIVGVVGFSESREQTQKAAAVLDQGQVPVIGTTATADAMQWDGDRDKRLTYYRPMAPSNSRESRTAAAFARSEHVVDDRGGHCRVPTHAVVVTEPGDLFSSEMSRMFARRFGSGAETLPLADRGEGGGMPPVAIAKTVCERIKDEPRTIVYWAARVRNFSAFVNAYGPDSGCGGLPQRLTVLGSNELTSTALRGKYEEPWLRLYHSVHVLPEKHPDSNGQADRLFQDYLDAYTAEDPWLNDGHVALAHDALKVLSTATDDAFSSTGTAHTELVKSKLDEEIVFQGASGVVHFPERHGSKPPPDKALTILHVTSKGPEVALHCGAFKENEPPVSRWGRDGEHECPTDG